MKIFLAILASLLVLIGGLWAASDQLITHQINRTLSGTKGYEGQVADVALDVLAGACMVRNIDVQQTVNDTLVSFVDVDSIQVSMRWDRLLEGELIGAVDIYRPVVNIVMTQDTTRRKQDVYFGKKLMEVIPFRVNEINVNEGKVAYTNYMVKPLADACLTNMQVKVKNLTNMEDTATQLPSSLTASAQAEGEGKLSVDMKMHLVNEIPVLHTDLELTSVYLPELNDFIKAHGNFDVQSGTLNLYAQLEIKDQTVEGYLRPVFYDLEVFSLEQATEQSMAQSSLGALIGLGNSLLESNKKERISAKVPIQGEVGSIDTDISEALQTAMSR